MGAYLQVKEACLYLTDIICDENRPWKERHFYFKEWYSYILMWKEFDRHGKIIHN